MASRLSIEINRQRLHESLAALGEIGRTRGGGVTRLALSDEDKLARDLVRQWMEEAGLSVTIDDFGNMVGRREGTQRGSLPVRLGSHCDTVPNGGRYDGVLGVVGALEVVRALNEHNVQTKHPIEVVNWTNEEGVRFQPAMLGSGAAIGRFSKEYVYSRTDAQGRSFGDELLRIGYVGDARYRPGPCRAYLELHIEQGPVLDTENLPVGVVEGISGIAWCLVKVEGRSGHSGTTPLNLRHDALVAAADIIQRVRRLVLDAPSTALGTVGWIQVKPNAVNVIPAQVTFTVDFRSKSEKELEALVSSLEAHALDVGKRTGCHVTVDRYWLSEPTPFDSNVIGTVARAVAQVGLPVRRLWSGAGHDAKYMQDISPAAMIFVRSYHGLSHCPEEYSSPEDVEAGVKVLLHATLELAEYQ